MKKDLVWGLTTAILCIVAPAEAGTRADVYAAIQRCDAVPNDRAWLDCLYGAAQPMRAELGLPPAPDAQQRLVPPGPRSQPTAEASPPPGVNPVKNTGVLAYLLGGNLAVNRMPLASYRFDPNGLFTVTLANGEVWQQMKDDDHFARWKAPAAHYLVSRSMALGSYVLTVQGEDGVYKAQKMR